MSTVRTGTTLGGVLIAFMMAIVMGPASAVPVFIEIDYDTLQGQGDSLQPLLS